MGTASKTTFALLTAITIGNSFVAEADAQRIVWTEAGHGLIRSANLDGSDQQTLVTLSQPSVFGIAADLAHGHLYWVNDASAPFVVQRSALDGSNVVDLVPTNGGLNSTTEFVRPVSISLDPTGVASGGVGKMYVGEVETFYFKRSNLDGSNLQIFVDALGNDVGQRGVALDLDQQRMFWSNCCSEDGFVSGIYRVDLDGTGLVNLAVDEIGRGVAYNPINDMVYWISESDDVIERMSANGGLSTVVVPGIDAYSLALDPNLGKMFWGGTGGIWSSNIDGTNVTQIVSLASGTVQGIAIVPEPASISNAVVAFLVGAVASRPRRRQRKE